MTACASCHSGSSAWEDTETTACLSCHDDEDAIAHAALNTHEVYGESCDTCHGPGRDNAVSEAHDWLR